MWPPATVNEPLSYFHSYIEETEVEPQEIPSCFIPCLLVVFTRQLEILVTPLEILGCFVLQHGYGLVLFH